MKKDDAGNGMGIFYIYYAVSFMGMAIYNTFFSVFFTEAGMTSAQLGLLFGLAPCVGLVFQPLWGYLADRAGSKNAVLKGVIVGVMLTIALFFVANRAVFATLNAKLGVLSALLIVFTAFNNSIIPLQDTVTLDYIQRTGRGFYGNARMSGTLGYTLMAVVAGFILNAAPGAIFPVYFVTVCGIFLLAARLPRAAGYRRPDEKGSVREVLRDREVFLMLLLIMVQYVGLSFGHTYCGPYMLQLGGNRALVGVASAVMALAEIPFHLKWGRAWIERVGIHKILIAGLLVGAARWTLTAVCRSPWMLIATMLFQGFMLVPMIVGVVQFVNGRVAPRLKATAQTALTLFSIVIARTVANIGGGLVIELFDQLGYNGISMAYAVLVPLCLVSAFAIGLPLLKQRRLRLTREGA